MMNMSRSAAGECERRTKTVMMKERKKARMPDITYDLDGDGVVNERDYFIAKLFDKDKDGKLNQEEYQTAIKALEDGFEQRFMYGVEKTAGLKEHLRVMQKRGKILVGEDFNPLTETYPVHPLTMQPRRHQDRTEMMNKRKEGACEEAAQERDLWDKANPYFIDRKYIKPEGYVDSPLYTSVNQIRKEKKKQDRGKAGLTEKPVF